MSGKRSEAAAGGQNGTSVHHAKWLTRTVTKRALGDTTDWNMRAGTVGGGARVGVGNLQNSCASLMHGGNAIVTQEASCCDLWLDSPVHIYELHFFKGRSLER